LGTAADPPRAHPRPVLAPRTATITATTHLHVKVLGREEFLAAVTGTPDSAQRADDVVSARLRASRQAGARDAIAAGPGSNHAGLTSPASQSRQAGPPQPSPAP
jgi:hypothetical protein